MKDFRDLTVWKKAHDLALTVYQITKDFPSDERFGLTSQLRRACVSIPANIAEGCGRGGDPELARFLQIAMGSASEVEYHILLAKDLGYLEESLYDQVHERVCEVKRMLASFIHKLRKADR